MQSTETVSTAILKSLSKANKIPNSILITGADSNRRLELARLIACLLVCEQRVACGRCTACQRIQRNVSLDFAVIIPEGQSVKVEQIREARQIISMAHSGPFILYVENAHLMTTEAQNAFLKSLEEPGKNIYIVLGAATTDSMLPTILSRCYKIPLFDRSLDGIVADYRGSADYKVEFCAFLSQGSDQKFREYVSDADSTIAESRDILEAIFSGRMDGVINRSRGEGGRANAVKVCETLIAAIMLVICGKSDVLGLIAPSAARHLSSADKFELADKALYTLQAVVNIGNNANPAIVLQQLMLEMIVK